MDIKYPLDKFFKAGTGESPDAAIQTDVEALVTPPALKAIAMCFFQLVSHTYGINHLTVIPGLPTELDDDAVYALTFHLEDAAETEYRQQEKLFADLADIPHFILDTDKGAVHAETLTDLVLGYAALAQKHDLSLAPLYTLGDLEGCDPASSVLQNHYLRAIKTNPFNIVFLQDCDSYANLTDLASHAHRAFGARENGHYAAIYSYLELTRMAEDYDLHRDLKCAHVPVWQN